MYARAASAWRALATLGVAARHVYVQSLPPGSLPSCGAPLAVLLKFTPVFEVIRKVLTGSGECGEVNWRFLGLAMPAWVLIWALALGGASGLIGQPQAKRLPQHVDVHAVQGVDVRHAHALVHLVDRRIHHAELHHLRARAAR